MVAALRQLGFDKVFDTDFAADLTIMEEGSELLDRLTRYLKGDKDVCLPILTSCCPALGQFLRTSVPRYAGYPVDRTFTQQMFGAIAKTIGQKR